MDVSENPISSWNCWLQPFLDLFFPPICMACRKSLSGSLSLCDSCAMEIRYLHTPLCVRCGAIFAAADGEDHLCGSCLSNPPPFSMARGVVLYAPPVSNLLHRLKYGTDRTVLSTVTHIAVKFDFTAFSSCDLIVPVPLHPIRLRERGLNQSLILAHIFFPKKTKKIFPHILMRTRDTIPQTSLNGNKRRRNLRGAFTVKRERDISGQVVCLVDDVFTTGTTVCECARTLLQAGAKDVKVITMARVAERMLFPGM
jgi:ComF family protein